MNKKSAVWYALFVLFLINTLNFFDRQILGAVGEPIRREFGLSDAALGGLGTAFTILYAFVGIPFGRLADKFGRKKILSVGVFVWSLLTAGSGLANGFWQIFALRLGVGVGEASCAPAASSLIGDLFPAERRAKALSIFMLGLPFGIALSFAVSGTIAKIYGWRWAFFVAGVPGILCAVAVLFIKEPQRGAAETGDIGEKTRAGSPYKLILKSPTMRLLILSGAVHNFNLYALGAFITPFLMRFHGLDIQNANFAATVIYGAMGAPALLLSGFIGGAARRKSANAPLLVTVAAIALSIPLLFFALQTVAGNIASFLILMGAGYGLMCFYYALVYATIQETVEPALRGTAMSVYFFAMYVLGASIGPYATGVLSDFFTKRAANLAGINDFSSAALEPFRAEGLHSAMYLIPILSVALALILYAASRTVAKEINDLQSWIKASANDEL